MEPARPRQPGLRRTASALDRLADHLREQLEELVGKAYVLASRSRELLSEQQALRRDHQRIMEELYEAGMPDLARSEIEEEAAFLIKQVDAIHIRVDVARDSAQQEALDQAERKLRSVRARLRGAFDRFRAASGSEAARAAAVDVRAAARAVREHFGATNPEFDGAVDARYSGVVMGCTMADRKTLRSKWAQLDAAAGVTLAALEGEEPSPSGPIAVLYENGDDDNEEEDEASDSKPSSSSSSATGGGGGGGEEEDEEDDDEEEDGGSAQRGDTSWAGAASAGDSPDNAEMSRLEELRRLEQQREQRVAAEIQRRRRAEAVRRQQQQRQHEEEEALRRRQHATAAARAARHHHHHQHRPRTAGAERRGMGPSLWGDLGLGGTARATHDEAARYAAERDLRARQAEAERLAWQRRRAAEVARQQQQQRRRQQRRMMDPFSGAPGFMW